MKHVKATKKINLISKAIKMTVLGYKAESLRNKIKRSYYDKGIEDAKYLQKLMGKYYVLMEKFNDLDTSYVMLKNSLTF